MIKSTTKLRMRQRTRKDKMPIRKLATSMIKINRIKDNLPASINDRPTEIPAGTVEEKWNAFKSIVYKVSKGILCTAVRKHEDWFDGNRMELEEVISNRNLASNNMLNKNMKSVMVRYRTCCQLLYREIKNKSWPTKALELQIFAQSNNPKGFYQNRRILWGPRVNHSKQLLTVSNKTIIIEKCEFHVRWKNHFATFLNETSTIEQHAVDDIGQSPTHH